MKRWKLVTEVEYVQNNIMYESNSSHVLPFPPSALKPACLGGECVTEV